MLEENIARLKSERADLEQKLSLPEIYEDQKKFSETLLRFNEIETIMGETSKEWEIVFEQLTGMD